MTTDAPSEEQPVIAVAGAPAPPPVNEGEINLVGKATDTVAPASEAPTWTFSEARIVTPPQLAVPSLGPIGRRRHPLVVLLLSIITLGFYNVIWHRKVNHEMGDFDARIDVSPGLSTFSIFIPWLAGFAVTVSGAALIGLRFTDQPALAAALPGIHTWMMFALLAGVLAVPYVSLVFSPAAVAQVMTLERLRLVEERVGMRSHGQLRPVARIWLLLIPIIGGMCHMLSIQRRLNATWAATVTAKVGP